MFQNDPLNPEMWMMKRSKKKKKNYKKTFEKGWQKMLPDFLRERLGLWHKGKV